MNKKPGLPASPNLPQKIRLNRLLAQHGLCSRRKADEWIEAGRVSLNGTVCRDLGTQVDPTTQTIQVDGVPLKKKPPRLYLALNKPKGVVTTSHDPQERDIIFDLLPPKYREAGVFSVGRLDSDSEGLILLTNDGDWGQILVHPRHEVWKEYWVEVDHPLTPAQLKKLQDGIELDEAKTLPARVRMAEDETKNSRRFYISIREGRNRQIRRMCQTLDLKVRRLRRVSVGPIQLGNLPSGRFRTLTKEEIQSVRALRPKKQTESKRQQNSD